MPKIRAMKILQAVLCAAAALSAGGCGLVEEASLASGGSHLRSFGQDLTFFSEYGVDAFLLGEGDSYIAVSADWQGRVLTSTFNGEDSPSIGWIDRALMADEKHDLSTGQSGGEDRFWVGPQGGDFSVFFPDGAAQNEENWRIPAALASEPWTLTARTRTQAKFEKSAEFKNFKGNVLKVKAEREVSFIPRADAAKILGIEIPDSVKMVAFQSLNKLTNAGEGAWSPQNGMLNISVQSCFNANPGVRVFLPYKPGDASKLGDVVRDNLYESAYTEGGRRVLTPEYVSVLADGKSMSGMGISPLRSEGIVLSYDSHNNILTVILYIKPSGRRAYLANSWRRPSRPFDGDAVSVYNNGSPARTSLSAQKYYEVSTYSPALNLGAGKSQFHLQRTFHFSGSEYDLGLIAYKLADISIGQLRGESL